jgi:hypothetical protein
VPHILAPGRAAHLAACALAAVLALGAAPRSGAAPAPATPARLTFVAPRVERGPVVDGRLDDPVWAVAAVLDSFTQFEPIEGVPDTIGTTCLVLYDRGHLYFGFRCRDRRGGVRAPMVPRDQAFEGDVVAVALDTFLDRQRSVMFGCSPRGVQWDALNSDANGTDEAPDFQFDSRARLTDDGWEAEIAIPFRTLRFPRRDTLAFGFNAGRFVQRTNATMFWAPLTRDRSSEHAQYGTLEGLTGVVRGRDVQLTPYASGSKTGEGTDGAPLVFEDPEARAGFDLRAGLASNVVANLAVNPDFSQIEADAGVIDLNQRFAIFYPEKRPFFLEGGDAYQTPLGIVYTRRISDPRYGVKLGAKSGGNSLAALNALDRGAGDSVETLPNRANPYLDTDATYTIVRLRRDVLKSSYLGVLAGSRTQLETYNRGAGFDGRLVPSDPYSIEFQSLWSWSRERDYRAGIASLTPAEFAALDDDVLAQDGEIVSGSAWTVRGARSSKTTELSLFTEDFSEHFAADMGFIPRNNVTNWGGNARYRKPGGERSWYSTIEPRLSVLQTHEHGSFASPGRLLDENIEAELQVSFRTNSDVGAGTGRIYTYEDGFEFPDQWRVWLFGNTEYLSFFHAGGSVSWGDDVVFDEDVPGKSFRTDVSGSLRFGPRYKLELGLRGIELWRAEPRTKFGELAIPRLRLDSQFTRELSFRAIAELRSERQFDTAGAVTESTRDVTFDLLTTWLLRPGTAVYLGWGAGLSGESLDAARPETSRVFAKMSWLFQL